MHVLLIYHSDMKSLTFLSYLHKMVIIVQQRFDYLRSNGMIRKIVIENVVKTRLVNRRSKRLNQYTVFIKI